MCIRFYLPTGRYDFLSNYFEYTFRLDHRDWRTVEHYYQAQKFAGTPLEERIRRCKTPDEAKGLAHSRKKLWRADWDEVKRSVMREAVMAKFISSGFLREELLATGSSVLIEDSPTDGFWGIGPDGNGRNMLGKILMETREALRRGTEEDKCNGGAER